MLKNILHIYYIFSSILLIKVYYAQTADTLWTRHYHFTGWEIFQNVKQTSDSGYICIGESTNFENFDNNLWVVKTDNIGSLEWQQQIGPKTSVAYGNDILEYESNYYCVGGYNNGSVTDTDELLILKIDTNGKFIWQKDLINEDSNVSNIRNYGKAIIKTYDNNLMVLGSTLFIRNDIFEEDIWLLKIDLDGNILWERKFDLGYSLDETPNNIIETSDSGFVIIGNVFTPFESPWEDLFLMKIDKNGNFLWSQIYGSDGYDSGEDLMEIKNGYLVAVGKYVKNFEAENNADLWLLKTNAFGDTVWTKKYGGDNTEWGYSIEITPDNGYIITGSTESFGDGFWDVWVVRTDSLGNKKWDKTFGDLSGDDGYSIQRTYDDGYIIGGYITSFDGGSRDGYLIKLAPENLTSVKEASYLISPKEYKLFQNYPNPFNPSTTISYSIPNTSVIARSATTRQSDEITSVTSFPHNDNTRVTLKVFDVLGREVATLVNQKRRPGNYDVNFNASNLASGVYYYQLKVGSFIKTKKMVVMK